ncbi:MAG: gamma-glutamylcyclotransferase [Pseudomonadota bacterium]
MKLDHVNIRTHQLDAMVKWYVDVLGLTEGWRPPFPFPGAWLYAGENAIVHLIGVATEPKADETDLKLEHFAVQGENLEATRARYLAADIQVDERAVPGTTLVQLNIWDPDGNHIHVDFDTAKELTADHRLVVYGTLGPGQVNEAQLADLRGQWQRGTVKGTLHQSGWGAAHDCPGVTLDTAGDEIEVHLFTSPDLPEHWDRLDAFEGADYQRSLTRVQTQNGEVDAWIYQIAT